jgi:tRNA(adenine34) deaminase
MEFSIYSDEAYMKMALQQAKLAAEAGEVPVGAIIVCKNTIVAKSGNSVVRLNDATAHAELMGISTATEFLGSRYLNDCTLFVTMEPCPMCAGALYWSQIGRIVYAATDDKRGCGLFTPSLYHPKTKVQAGLLAEESALLLKSFFKERR